MKKTLITKWNCEKCGKSGEFEHDLALDVWMGVQKTKEEHSKASPDCVFDVDSVRVSMDCGETKLCKC